jgi:hypothetical protein
MTMDRDYDERWAERTRRERGLGYADAGGWGWWRGDGPARRREWREEERERGYWPPYDDSYYDRPRSFRDRDEGPGWFAGNESGPRHWTPYNAPRWVQEREHSRGWTGRHEERPREFGRGGWGGWGDWRPSEREHERGWFGGGEGSFAGRGPKGYRRSDERIREEINEHLTDAFDVDPSDVDVTVKNGEVWLRGTVSSRYAKRRIEHVADGVRGVEDVHNEIRIAGPPLPAEEGVPDSTVRGRPRTTRPTSMSEANGIEPTRR